MTNPFQTQQPHIGGNPKIREPQKGAYQALHDYASNPEATDREVGIVLPVGCGKSGTITLAPFAFRSNRTLVIAPGVPIANQLAKDFDPSNAGMFYQKCSVLAGPPFPEPVEIRGTDANRADLDEAHVVITNIQQLQGQDNRWLMTLPADYFDLILFDEGHHSVAQTWEALKQHFPAAKIVNFSATPQRADGQLMAGHVLYSYPIFKAIQAGYVKRLKAVQLNPRTLRYVRREGEAEIEVSLAEVRQLGETDADFRRSIVTSTETLNTIVDASIRELARLRAETKEGRLKIIASALNFEHCRQIVEAYRARNRRADYVHSKQDGQANKRVMQQLEAHELDVIVQVRKLGEGFDHPFLSVAAVFSIFANLSPFVQFVGRIMRAIIQNAPDAQVNQGVVIFHAGANIARQWGDFQQYSEADQAYFDQLLPLEGLDPANPRGEREIIPIPRPGDEMEVRAQSEVQLEEIHLLEDDEAKAIGLLQERGIIPCDFDPQRQMLQPVQASKVAVRRAMRSGIDMRVRTEAARILHQRGMNPEGRDLDRQRLGRSNLIVLKAAIDHQVNAAVGRNSGQRSEFSRAELEQVDAGFSDLVAAAVREVFNGD
ncbi:DEAD/DEAH box helicase family protein [Xanthomonas citri pv. citri]|uniref:DEAD/DEAH box helicase n=1 Tax=Xanthomonas TaxID=338 RepID=UPI000A2FFB8B|nr:DEAD/DEAH box helicase family protein [Xanthomonas citri]ARR15390.1 DEAD/DEAH box helicase [Xanthomonas citri pv. citri]ARR20090.1 DEAD/DEAH box helicase [Xanthomonas citri pv. citri]ARR24755.1 DEAD/DEAH box helicase [Xanthomonas citri pv. citri]MBD4835358.1 DEAD/DEAH box helicase family protein [Xanthomonas citri pv. citri]MBD4863817.1 DEAD/DEAH box helicase family protein [Xanthomonas citri pv. citri]